MFYQNQRHMKLKLGASLGTRVPNNLGIKSWLLSETFVMIFWLYYSSAIFKCGINNDLVIVCIGICD